MRCIDFRWGGLIDARSRSPRDELISCFSSKPICLLYPFLLNTVWIVSTAMRWEKENEARKRQQWISCEFTCWLSALLPMHQVSTKCATSYETMSEPSIYPHSAFHLPSWNTEIGTPFFNNGSTVSTSPHVQSVDCLVTNFLSIRVGWIKGARGYISALPWFHVGAKGRRWVWIEPQTPKRGEYLLNLCSLSMQAQWEGGR